MGSEGLNLVNHKKASFSKQREAEHKSRKLSKSFWKDERGGKKGSGPSRCKSRRSGFWWMRLEGWDVC